MILLFMLPQLMIFNLTINSMQSNRIPVCRIDLFDNSTDFWIRSTEGLLEEFPHLELPHENNFHTLLILDKGDGELVIDYDKSRIDSNQVVIIKPNCINKLYLNREATGKVICFTEDFFSLRYNNNILKQFSLFNGTSSTLMRIPQELFNYIKLLGNFMFNEYSLKHRSSKKVLRSFLNILLIELDRVHTPVKTITDTTPTKEKVQRFQKLIEKNFRKNKMPSEYADMLNISTNYLNKICKQTLRQTSGDLIRKHIILEAQRQLHYTNLSVNEIANELGFDHPSYFITLFKKVTDQTPEQFRKGRIEQ